ncbi:Carboxylesterase [Ostertagia ostertagi]
MDGKPPPFQVQALRWVKTEIVNFGGDPNRITLAGQGDGGCAVCAHTLSPMSQNLFNQAIVQSGPLQSCYSPDLASTVSPQTTQMPVLQYDAGAPYNQGSPGYNNQGNQQQMPLNQGSIRNDPGSSYNAGNIMYDVSDPSQQLAQQTTTASWMIVRDDAFLPDSIENLAARRPRIPIIIGTVQDENADYAFKLISTGESNESQGEMFNNWMLDFARQNRLDPNTANQDKFPVNKRPERLYGNLVGGYRNTAGVYPAQNSGNTYQNNGYSGQSNGYGNQNVGYSNQNNGYGNQNGGYSQGQPVAYGPVNGQGSNQYPVPGSANEFGLQYDQNISSDAGTVSQTATEIDSFMQNGNQYVRVYQFTHVSDLGRQNCPIQSWKPVYKGQDMIFLFMSETIWSSGNSAAPTTDDFRMADQMGEKWTQFAKEGQVSSWQPSNPQDYSYCNLNRQPTVQSGYAQQARNVFNNQVDPIVQQVRCHDHNGCNR